nr:MAG TPA: hypothetical protein [Caudoviricetes sp.]
MFLKHNAKVNDIFDPNKKKTNYFLTLTYISK